MNAELQTSIEAQKAEAEIKPPVVSHTVPPVTCNDHILLTFDQQNKHHYLTNKLPLPLQQQEPQPIIPDIDEISRLKSEIESISVLYERSKARIAVVEEERTRLEAETKDLERTISRSMHPISTPTNTSVQRQVSS